MAVSVSGRFSPGLLPWRAALAALSRGGGGCAASLLNA